MRKLILVPILALLTLSVGLNSWLLFQQNNKLGEINSGVSTIKNNLSNSKNDISVLQGNISNIQGGILTLQTGVNSLQGNVSYLQGSYAGLQGIYSNVQGNLTNLQSGLQSGLSTLQGNLTALQGKVTDLGGKVTTIQTDVNKANTNLAIMQAAANETLSQTELVKLVQPVVVRIELTTSTLLTGSGVIISSNGYIMTAAHVVENATAANITFQNGQRFLATVVASDAKRDIAILKISSNRADFPTAAIGSSTNTSVGENVMASGYALALKGNVTYTMGIVSAFRIYDNLNYIQTDAPINPGNSGGPLFNMRGQVIGINVGKLVGDYVDNLGLAVPIDEAKTMIQNTVK